MKKLHLAVAVALALTMAAAVAAAPPPTKVPGQLIVGVDLPSEGFQVGVVRGTEVLYAQGLEIDLARELASRLELDRTVFVQSRFDRLFSAGSKPWDLAMAEITITDERKRTTTFSRPYMSADQGVLAAQTLRTVPTTIAGLRALRLCALRRSTGAVVARRTIRPTTPVLLVGNVPTLMLDLQTGRCDAVVYDAPALGTLKSRAPLRYGPFVGVIETGEEYGIALPRGTQLLSRVNKAVAELIADGTVARLQRKWITVHLDDLPVLR
jgi:polar amino acid transport system substrate-binding protein